VPTQKLPRREREKLRQRGEILEIALNLFAEKGFHGVSMHEVAGKAEFAIGTLYKFFQSKEDLYKALVLEQCAKIPLSFGRFSGQRRQLFSSALARCPRALSVSGKS